jgi:hypothetical protein
MVSDCATGLTVNDRDTGGAAAYDLPPAVPPACAAVMVHVPGMSMSTNPPLVTVQMVGVVDV